VRNTIWDRLWIPRTRISINEWTKENVLNLKQIKKLRIGILEDGENSDTKFELPDPELAYGGDD